MLKLIKFKAVLVTTYKLKYYVLKNIQKLFYLQNAAFESN